MDRPQRAQRSPCLTLIAAAGLALSLARGADRCDVCGERFGETIYSRPDAWTREKRSFCGTCRLLDATCAVCLIPAKRNVTTLKDGRFLCELHAPLVFLDPQEALSHLASLRPEIDRTFARFLAFPSTNVDFAFANQVHMQQLSASPGFERQCPSLLGYTRSLPLHDGAWQHTIRVLSALPRSQTVAVYVHELTHTWIKEHVPAGRRLAQHAAEGFCELLACRFLETLGEQEQITRLKRSDYTLGQLDLFLTAADTFDLYPILQWMKYGRDPFLIEADPDRLRALDLPTPPQSGTLPQSPPPAPAPAIGPETWTLQGILGTGPRRTALINKAMVSVGDTANGRLGTNSVRFRCLDLGDQHARIEVLDSGERLELRLHPPPATPN